MTTAGSFFDSATRVTSKAATKAKVQMANTGRMMEEKLHREQEVGFSLFHSAERNFYLNRSSRNLDCHITQHYPAQKSITVFPLFAAALELLPHPKGCE